ncbi:MAG: general stress protein [Candidatus Microsaccharimonas sp.]
MEITVIGEEETNQMAGTKEGGVKAAAKNLQRDPDFYAKIGAKGGRNGRTGGFAANPELARIAGAKGGRISRRRKTEA